MDEIVFAKNVRVGEKQRIVHFLLVRGFGWFYLDGNQNIIVVTKSPRTFLRTKLSPEMRTAIGQLTGVVEVR